MWPFFPSGVHQSPGGDIMQRHINTIAFVLATAAVLGSSYYIAYIVARDGICVRPLPHRVEACERLR